MSRMLRLIGDLYLYDFAPVSPAADKAVGRFQEELDFKVHEFPSGLEQNGWTVPNSWCYTKAEIRKGGKLVYDGRKHPLGVVGYSPAFQGRVDLATLKQHLYYSNEFPDELVFHCTHFYRQLEREWGFVVPKNLFDSLSAGEYDVEIVTEEKKGTMKVLEYTLPGASKETIFFHGHNCHPGQANDDLSGCAVGIEVMCRLAQEEQRHYTYTLLISSELFGSFFWLASQDEKARRNLKYGVMLKSVGNDLPLKLQLSYLGNTPLDLAARNALRALNPQFVEGPFRRVYGNDETIFEAPGFEIPTISLTRYPFPEYHTSKDTPAILSETRLEETVLTNLEISFALEKNVKMKRNFEGLLAMSHPKYNLYQPFWNPAEKAGPTRGSQNEWHYLMIDMFRDFNENISVLEVAERHRLPFREVLAYLTKLAATGAISFVPVANSRLAVAVPLVKRNSR